jgi:hypothetical protein
VDADPSLTAHLLALVRMRAFAILAMSWTPQRPVFQLITAKSWMVGV